MAGRLWNSNWTRAAAPEPIGSTLKLAQVANRQLAISRAVLAQQLAGAVDPGAMASLANSRGGGGSFVPFVPVVTGGAVGYQPVVVPVTEGAMLYAWAVISADRRYVRVSPMPQFSGIARVTVFNFATGETLGWCWGNGRSRFWWSFWGWRIRRIWGVRWRWIWGLRRVDSSNPREGEAKLPPVWITRVEAAGYAGCPTY